MLVRPILNNPDMSRADFAVRPARDGVARRQYVEVVTRRGERFRIPATDRPVPRHLLEREDARSPAEAVCNRLHLWHMVSAY